MKRKILGVILTLALTVTVLPITGTPRAQASSSDVTLADAYSAYYSFLMELVDEYGIGLDPIIGAGGPSNMQGVYFAELVDFNSDGIPELLLRYSDGSYSDYRTRPLYIYGYLSELLSYGEYRFSEEGYCVEDRIVTDQNSAIYFLSIDRIENYETGEVRVTNTYFTLINGKWTEVPESGINIATTRELLPDSDPDSVRAVLAQLQTLQTATTPPAAALDALPSAWSLNVNGGALRGTDMYNIGGSNYLKIRDIASLLDGTDKQFNITVDGRTVDMTPGAAYEQRGDEMAANPNAVKTKTSETTFSFTLGGKPIELTAYMIAGSNYVKIRDVLRLFDVYVDYNASLREFYIDTTKAYVDN